MKNAPAKFSRVMLIDDSEIDNFINNKMIQGCNFAQNIYIHSSGKSALEFLKNIEKMGDGGLNLMPNIIFLDINMPMMDGFQFIDEFEKLNEKTKKEIRIIILSTSVNPTDLEKSHKNKHIVQYINKPLSQLSLDNINFQL